MSARVSYFCPLRTFGFLGAAADGTSERCQWSMSAIDVSD